MKKVSGDNMKKFLIGMIMVVVVTMLAGCPVFKRLGIKIKPEVQTLIAESSACLFGYLGYKESPEQFAAAAKVVEVLWDGQGVTVENIVNRVAKELGKTELSPMVKHHVKKWSGLVQIDVKASHIAIPEDRIELVRVALSEFVVGVRMAEVEGK